MVSVQGERPEDVVRNALGLLREQADDAQDFFFLDPANAADEALAALVERAEAAERLARHQAEEIDALARVNEELREAIALIDSPYPEAVFTPFTPEELEEVYAAMRAATPHATERMYAYVARERGIAVRAALDREATLAGGGDEGVRVARAADPGVTPAASVDREAAAEERCLCAEDRGSFDCPIHVPGGAQTPEETPNG